MSGITDVPAASATSRARVRHLFSIRDLSAGDVDRLLSRAAAFEASRDAWPRLDRVVVGLAFFEPSTRTRVGFHAAAARLGATAIDVFAQRYAPGMSAPESLSDTLRVLSGYCDVLVVRHPSESELRTAIAVSRVPVINGGCGTSEHPTQALIDLFAIRKHFGRAAGLRIGLVGALARSRAASSLLDVLALDPPAELRLMAPNGLQPAAERLRPFAPRTVSMHDELDVASLDVLYVAGMPEGEGDQHLDADARHYFRVTADVVATLAPQGIVLCPLPRIDEIMPGVDYVTPAAYMSASDAALHVRMAVLEAGLEAPRSAAKRHRAVSKLEKDSCSR
jgi:aspartate carbamoyltransferase catalytic subunit